MAHLLSIEKAAKLLGVSKAELERAIAAKELPVVVSTRTRVKEEDLLRWRPLPPASATSKK